MASVSTVCPATPVDKRYASVQSPLPYIQGETDVNGQVWRVIGTAPRDGTRVDLWCLFTSWGADLNSYAFRVIDCWFDGYWRRYDETLGNEAPVENVYTDGGAVRACMWAEVPEVPDLLATANDDDSLGGEAA